MKRLLAVMALTLPILSACGEKKAMPYIEVDGKAKIEKAAETFSFKSKIQERNTDRQQSLAAASAKLDEVRDKLGRMKGLESLEIEAGNISVSTIRPKNCSPEERYSDDDYPADCEPLAHISTISFSVKGAPASAAGNALSMVSELNVETAGELEFEVKDPDAAKNEVRQAALVKAMQAAGSLAAKANAQVSTPLVIDYSEPSYDEYDTIVLSRKVSSENFLSTLPQTIPGITLDLPADKVAFEAKVKVKFALEKPKAEK